MDAAGAEARFVFGVGQLGEVLAVGMVEVVVSLAERERRMIRRRKRSADLARNWVEGRE
jgi:hypothetical protein